MNHKKTLAQVIGSQLLSGEYNEDRAYKFKDILVVVEYRNFTLSPDEKPDEQLPYGRWPGSHNFVYYWAELENGYAVGRNENPARGLSFPVVKMPSQK